MWRGQACRNLSAERIVLTCQFNADKVAADQPAYNQAVAFLTSQREELAFDVFTEPGSMVCLN